VRLAGVETGEYHVGQQIQQDQYDRMKTMPAVVAAISKPEGWTTAVLNHKQGLMTDKRVRQAFQAALDMEPIMAAGFGNKAFYRLDPGLSFAEQPQWHSRVAGELYNQRNPAKAKKLLADAGYAGQPVRWITTKEYQWMYKNALVAKQQLEAAGFVIDLQVVDWATLVQRRNKPELYDVFSTGITFGAYPPQAASLQCNWPGWWCQEEKDKLLVELAADPDAKKRKALLDRIQTIFYEDVGRVKFGDYFSLDVNRKELRGDFRTSVVTYYWNAWLTR